MSIVIGKGPQPSFKPEAQKHSRVNFILSPHKTLAPKVKQMTPDISTVEDIKVIGELLSQTSIVREIESALETLQSANWGNADISSALFEQGEAILQRCSLVTNTCWYDLSGYKVMHDHHRDRARGICHFLEWFYYSLTVEQRRKLKNWPNVNIAHALAQGELLPDPLRGKGFVKKWVSEDDLLLATSIIAKLNHVSLGPKDSCYFCFMVRLRSDSTFDIKKRLETIEGPEKSLDVIERLGRLDRIHGMIAACIFSDADCLLHYSKPESDEKINELMHHSINDYRELIDRWKGVVNMENYHKDLKILLNKFWNAADDHDPRTEWLDHLDSYLTSSRGEFLYSHMPLSQNAAD
jgi:hypothetical protein